MDQKFCQSCGMPMEAEEMYGTEADGRKNADYCKYCYEKGKFTFDGNMDEMIEICIPPTVECNKDMTAQQARAMMEEFFPKLKRWSTN